ncbi:MAG: hypothetical protein AAFX99_18370, partial [Myxococcota bacterium]
RLNTSLGQPIAEILFNQGLDRLLSTDTQLGFGERDVPFKLVEAKVHDDTKVGEVDFEGPMGTYLREIFFHIPFLIANHLNSQGKFEKAQRWYHTLFNPTASDSIQGLPNGLSDEERRRRELDRNWRYREFRGVTVDALRTQLTDGKAIDAYRKDPFNPHAVARLRLTAYQKAIVMKYIDNLLDWGDDLFTRAFAQQNPEYLREATLKYVVAQEILGDRPRELGDCGEGEQVPKTFPAIKDALSDGSEFLMEVESIAAARYRSNLVVERTDRLVAIEHHRAAQALSAGYHRSGLRPTMPRLEALSVENESLSMAVNRPVAALSVTTDDVTVQTSYADILASSPNTDQPITQHRYDAELLHPEREWIPHWGLSLARELNPVFCVPGNRRMLAAWDRVEDRLYKVRHCMDINGVQRQLPLFSPPIDPSLLVSGRANGLSLDDILASTFGALPPYRFRYLVEKAKGYASTVQAFGSALLGALEKRDAKEMIRLRNVHQKNMLTLTTEIMRNELKVTEEGVHVAMRRRQAAQYRHDHYKNLISSGLLPTEAAQNAGLLLAMMHKDNQMILAKAAGVSYLLAQVGSPFAMTFGGQQIGSSTDAYADYISILKQISDITANAARLAAGFKRREQGWQHQQRLASHDLKRLEKELAIAHLRKSIALRRLELHEKTQEQHDEMMDLFEDQFSNLGLYTHLSRALQQLHREAYNNALAMARLAEQAYRFERPGDHTLFVGGEWDASRAGLLAGERLSLALQNMDKRFIETYARGAEINQSFSLTQIDPLALIDLKETGACTFELPEFFFDMFYPGHYRRRIRAVRLTMPCITGPYTNISAKLTLLRSHIRRDATLGAAHLLEVPPTGTTTVAMSTSMGDAGVFELNFRDERTMPFEGAGAISMWRLELPSHFRPFDYHSINDVILNVSYTAEEDGVLRQEVESHNTTTLGSLLHVLSNNPLTRVFSLRQEFSKAFNRLLQATVGTPVTFEFNERHFPLFLQGREVQAVDAHIVLALHDRSTATEGVSLSINGTTASDFTTPSNPPTAGEPFGGLPHQAINAAFTAGLKRQHTLIANDAGNLTTDDSNRLDPDAIRDIMLVVRYQI